MSNQELCQYVGYVFSSENLNWAAQNLRLGRIHIADLLHEKTLAAEVSFRQ